MCCTRGNGLYIEERAKEFFEPFGFVFERQYRIFVPKEYPYSKYIKDAVRKIDLAIPKCSFMGSQPVSVAIEVKSSEQDMESGAGLSQEMMDYGYVLVPDCLAFYAKWRLEKEGLNKTGIIILDKEDNIYLYKKAVCTKGDSDGFKDPIKACLMDYHTDRTITISMGEYSRLKKSAFIVERGPSEKIEISKFEYETLKGYKEKYNQLINSMSNMVHNADKGE